MVSLQQAGKSHLRGEKQPSVDKLASALLHLVLSFKENNFFFFTFLGFFFFCGLDEVTKKAKLKTG